MKAHVKIMPMTDGEKKERKAMTINFYINKQNNQKPRVKVQSGQDLTGRVDISTWSELR